MNSKCGMIALRLALGIVILIQAVLFVMPGAAHEFARTHMPGFVRLVLGFGEIAGALLLLIPGTVQRGAPHRSSARSTSSRPRIRWQATHGRDL